jgi:hypothetical protein
VRCPAGADPTPEAAGSASVSDYADWILEWMPVDMLFITGTFDKSRCAVDVDGAARKFRGWVRRINRWYGGDRYRRKWGWSFFAYAGSVELHESGDPHLHALIGADVDYGLCHRAWNLEGMLWVRRVNWNREAALYVLKYALKSDLLMMYRPVCESVIVDGRVRRL